MAVTYGFFNSVDGDRVYNADQMSTYFKGLVGQGVYANTGGAMQVRASTGMEVQVLTGRAVIGETLKWLENDAVLNLTVNNAHVTLNRYTAIVIRCDYANREITITTKDGANATNPVKPAMTNTAEIKELCLAYIYVGAGTTAISQTNIEDTRSNNALCGWVTGLINQIDTSTLFAQWTSAYSEVISEMNATHEEIQRLRNIVSIAPLTSVAAHDVTVTTGSKITVTITDYSYVNTDVFYLFVNGLKVPVDAYSVTGSGSTLTVTFTGTNKPATGVVYSDVEVEIWRPSE